MTVRMRGGWSSLTIVSQISHDLFRILPDLVLDPRASSWSRLGAVGASYFTDGDARSQNPLAGPQIISPSLPDTEARRLSSTRRVESSNYAIARNRHHAPRRPVTVTITTAARDLGIGSIARARTRVEASREASPGRSKLPLEARGCLLLALRLRARTPTFSFGLLNAYFHERCR